jgi:hypothetical protein
MNANSNRSDFAKNFVWDHITRIFTELGCSPAQRSRLEDYFRQNSSKWTVTSSSQSEFDAIAETSLRSEYERHIKGIDKILRTGAAFRVPAHLRHDKFLGYTNTGREKISSTGLVEDAKQNAWLKLIEIENGNKSPEPAALNTLGQNEGRDAVREQRKYVPLPQPPDDESAPVAPWDELDPSDTYRANLNLEIERLFRNIKTASQEQIMRQFREESPDDYAFLVNYMAQRWKSRFTRAEQNRAGAIVKKLRRREAAEKAAEN